MAYGCRVGPWTPEEDELLIGQVRTLGPHDWTLISEGIRGRNGKSCRLRWCNQLDPDIVSGKFTLTEELTLMIAHRKYGKKWATISKFLRGRTDNQVKNHWNAKMHKRYPYVENDEFLDRVENGGVEFLRAYLETDYRTDLLVRRANHDDEVVKSLGDSRFRKRQNSGSKGSGNSDNAESSSDASNRNLHAVSNEDVLKLAEFLQESQKHFNNIVLSKMITKCSKL